MRPDDLTELDLLLDDSFLQYIRRNNDAAIAKWENYIALHPEIKETAAAAVSLYYNINTSEAESDKAAQLARLRASIEAGSSVNIRPVRRFSSWWRVAAAILLLAGITWLWSRQRQSPATRPADSYLVYSSEWGQRKILTLPDGSEVLLNANTTVRIPTGYGNKERLVELIKGAALFDVKGGTDNPFIVRSNDLQTTVLGTSFMVKSSPTALSTVSLLSGKVRVNGQSPQTTPVILSPGEQAGWDRHTQQLHKQCFDTVALRTWKTGKLVFGQASATDVIHRLEDWYGIPFEISGHVKNNIRFSGSFDNDKLEKVLNVFCFTAGCKFEMQPNKVLIQF